MFAALPPRLQASGFNSGFEDSYSNFADYIKAMREMIAKARLDLNDQNRE